MAPRKESRSVQLYFVLIMLCTVDRIASAPHGWAMEVWKRLFQAYSPKNSARLVVMMLGVLAFPLDTNDVVNSLETMERKIKEFERYANIEIPESLKIGLVIRQAEEGPMRTHFAQVGDLSVHQDRGDERQAGAECGDGKTGDATDVDAFTKGPSKGASRASGKNKDSEVVCWYCEKRGRRASDCRKKQKDHDKGQSTGSKKGASKAKGNKKEFKGKCHKCGKTGYVSKDCRSKETSAFEAGEEGLAETGCIDTASIDLNALEIGAAAGEGSKRFSFWDRLMCCGDCVPEDGGGRQPDAPNARQSKELQAGVRPASAGSWRAKGAGQAQRWVSSEREDWRICTEP